VRQFFLGELGQIRPNVPGMLFSEKELDMSAVFASWDHISNGVRKGLTCFNLPHVQESSPFLHYAPMYWMAHVRQSTGAGTALFDTSHPFLSTSEDGSSLRVNWLLSYLLETDDSRFITEYATERTDVPLLHMACWFGLEVWVQ
jgi:hypothetical protein